MRFDNFLHEGGKGSPGRETQRGDKQVLAVPALQRLDAPGWSDPAPSTRPATTDPAASPAPSAGAGAKSPYDGLLARRAQPDTLIQSRPTDLKARVIAQMLPRISRYGITAADLGLTPAAGHAGLPPGATRKASAAQAAPRYRDPETGKTWTGRGRAPLWLAGKDRAAYRIAPAGA